MLIEIQCLPVLFIDIYPENPILPGGKFQQHLPVSSFLIEGVYEKHLDEFFAQPNESHNFLLRVADEVEPDVWEVVICDLFCNIADLLLPESGECCARRLPIHGEVRGSLREWLVGSLAESYGRSGGVETMISSISMPEVFGMEMWDMPLGSVVCT